MLLEQRELLSRYEIWYASSKGLISKIAEDRVEEFENSYRNVRSGLSLDVEIWGQNCDTTVKYFSNYLKLQIDILSSLLGIIEINSLFEDEGKCGHPSETPITQLVRILERFHKVARQLRSRRQERSTIEIEDEYDVQDLLHALLRINFDDIRAEEWTPSYAGGSSRMDFLLKKEQIVIEVKKTRQSLKDKDIGEQLIVDIGKYAVHPECKILVCFVYDPEARVGNPKGLENDLNQMSRDGLQVIAKVEPDT
ncbi:hypothetical protein [uncultured Methanolobus sp.]|uniref:PD-(D/E)XK nuclease domain-containing protein n=1 Tax=uncultured Methanolobus sp. TaxID=218300 RepID=UPI0029C9899D|nr:hypothetical protein [uncultured Methanolobus sp.]